MKPVLKDAISGDVDLESFLASGPDPWCVPIQCFVGPSSGIGYESFQLEVCNPAWLQRQVEAMGIVSGRHLLVTDRFSWPIIRAYLEDELAKIEGDDWTTVGRKVARIGWWEFEDYDEWGE